MKLIIGDTTQYLAEYAFTLDSNAYLVNTKNIDNTHQGTVYTSLGDVSKSELGKLVQQATNIEYYPPEVWSGSKLHENTEKEIILLSKFHQIDGLERLTYNKNYFLELCDQRQTNNPQLWCVGCSFTQSKLFEKEKEWPSLVSDQLNQPVSILARPSAGVSWAADQILRSDIRKGDTIIWALTTVRRFTIYQPTDNIFVHHSVWNKHKIASKFYSLDYLLDDYQLLVEGIMHIQQIINMSKKLDVNLVLVSIIDDEFMNYLDAEIPHLDLTLGMKFVDYAWDNLHPGPEQHKLFAKKIAEFVDNQSF